MPRDTHCIDAVIQHHAILKHQRLTAYAELVVSAVSVLRIKEGKQLAEISLEEECLWFKIERLSPSSLARAAVEGVSRELALMIKGAKADQKTLCAGQVEIAKDIQPIGPLRDVLWPLVKGLQGAAH